ncbi:YczE/YyaS/YitT family protein [Streptomyces sp. NRRL S-813]|uniref:membrane protein YczE n=1 Tax=Streptomyces sp. NRRL S-813 TaxID=1463919 RepID=UPI000689C513|nr:membrane protein [Streptomyces sp. NRRL S-813]
MTSLKDRPGQRSLRLALGLALYGMSLAMLVKTDFGADPWTVFTQGLSQVTGFSLGQTTIVISLALLALWCPLRQRPGVGTVANALLVGPFLDLGMAWIPTPGHWGVRVLFLAMSVVGVAVATGLYVGAGWGPGPRDGLMTGLTQRGVPLIAARAGIEVTVLIIGWLLGGNVGLATVVFAAGIGPLVGYALPRLTLAVEGRHGDGQDSAQTSTCTP